MLLKHRPSLEAPAPRSAPLHRAATAPAPCGRLLLLRAAPLVARPPACRSAAVNARGHPGSPLLCTRARSLRPDVPAPRPRTVSGRWRCPDPVRGSPSTRRLGRLLHRPASPPPSPRRLRPSRPPAGLRRSAAHPPAGFRRPGLHRARSRRCPARLTRLPPLLWPGRLRHGWAAAAGSPRAPAGSRSSARRPLRPQRRARPHLPPAGSASAHGRVALPDPLLLAARGPRWPASRAAHRTCPLGRLPHWTAPLPPCAHPR